MRLDDFETLLHKHFGFWASAIDGEVQIVVSIRKLSSFANALQNAILVELHKRTRLDDLPAGEQNPESDEF